MFGAMRRFNGAAECCVWRGNQPKGASALECHRASRRHIDRDEDR
jgi:hypothetical protein